MLPQAAEINTRQSTQRGLLSMGSLSTWPVGQIQNTTCLRMAHPLSMAFTDGHKQLI